MAVTPLAIDPAATLVDLSKTTTLLEVVVVTKLWTALRYREHEKQEQVVWFFYLGLITSGATLSTSPAAWKARVSLER